MTTLDALTSADLKRLAGNKVFARGQGIFADGRSIIQYLARPGVVQARVAGNYGVYHVSLADGKRGLEIECSCPYDWGDVCKHAVAVGLRWIAEGRAPAVSGEPCADLVPAALRDALEGMEHGELVELICSFALENPEFREDLLERVELDPEGIDAQPSQEGVVARLKREIDGFVQTIEGQRRYHRHDEYGYGREEPDSYPELASVVKTARTLPPEDRAEVAWHLAASCETLFNADDEYEYEHGEGYIGTSNVEDAIDLYAEAVAASETDPDMRAEILSDLADACGDWHMCYYGTVLDRLGAAMRTIAQGPDELLRALERFKRFPGNRAVSELRGRLLLGAGAKDAWLEFREANLNDASDYLELADFKRAEGLPGEAVSLLERWAEKALEGGGFAGGPDAGKIFDQLEAHFAERGADKRLLWVLLLRAEARAEVLDVYPRAKEAADRLGDWPKIRAELMGVARRRHDYRAMIEIRLRASELEEALDLAREPGCPEAARLHAAKAVEEELPEEAMNIYKALVNRGIDSANRRGYAEAAAHARRIKGVMVEVLGDQARWEKYLGDIRRCWPRRKALLEEFSGL